MSSEAASDTDEAITKDINVQTSVMQGGICTGPVAWKLVIMSWLWVAALFTYSMINIYLKYIPGSIYLNFAIAGISEIIAHIVVGLLFLKLTPRWTFFMGFTAAFAGGICLVWQNKFADNSALIAGFVLLAKFGCSMAVCACYVSTPFVFPLKICGTAFGICNCFARFVSISSPIIAEREIPVPMAIFSFMTLISIFVSLLIKISDK